MAKKRNKKNGSRLKNSTNFSINPIYRREIQQQKTWRRNKSAQKE